MGPTSADVARITAGNVRVPVAEFAAVWSAAGTGADPGWYREAVARTCRWMAAAPLRTALCGGLPRSPVTWRACVARPDLIEAELAEADRLRALPPETLPAALADRPGWLDGAGATLRWAWRHDGPPPIGPPIDPVIDPAVGLAAGAAPRHVTGPGR